MEIKIVLFITVLLYTVIVSQSFSYIISLRNVQQHMNVTAYIAFRKRTDKNFRLKYKWVIYAGLFFNVLLVVMVGARNGGLLFITSAIAFIALVTDTLLAIKGNVPINNTINSWSVEKYPCDWASYRTAWLAIFCKRQTANITGFISLLAGAIFT